VTAAAPSFQGALQRLEAELDVPYPERRELLDEIGAHLEALDQDLVAGGASTEQAYYAALETMALDGEFVASIGAVHRSAVARALARLPRAVSLGLEYAVITTTGVLILGSIIFQEAPMLEFVLNGGFFMIPLNLAGLAIIVLGIERIYSLFLKKDHAPENLGKRLRSIRFLGVLTALTGVIGTMVGAYHAFSQAPEIAARHGGEFPVYLVVSIALTTAIWGLSLTLIAEIAHFVVKSKAERIGRMRLGHEAA